MWFVGGCDSSAYKVYMYKNAMYGGKYLYVCMYAEVEFESVWAATMMMMMGGTPG
jgi:hypothetical protein